MTAARDERSGLDDLSPSALLDALAAEDLAERIAQRNKLRIVHQWAVLHPATTVTGTSTWGGESMLLVDESLGGDGCPGVEAFTAEPLAVTLGISPASAQQLLSDVLDLRYRLPRTWALAQSLKVPAWKARRVATATHALSRDVAAEIDEALAPRLHRLGPTAIDNAVAHAVAKAQPVEHLDKERHAQAAWDVVLHTPETLDFAGTSELHVTGDTPALTRLYRRICRQAAAAGRAGDDRPLGIRKAHALMDLGDRPMVEEVAQRPSRDRRARQTTLYLHADMTDLLDGVVGIGRAEKLGPITTDKIRDWVGRGKVRIQPVIWMHTGQDSEECVDAHDPPDRIRETVILRDRHCVFPGCTVDARRCDLDHIDAYDPTGPPGQTAPSKLAALCRRHHRAKTSGLWRYRRLPSRKGGYVWAGPGVASVTGQAYGRSSGTPRNSGP